ncbi:MAG: hypothetical protein RIA69_20320 [Cyclobacteriaceae bacterium]
MEKIKYSILLLSLLFSINSYAQLDLRENRHIFKYDLALKECKFDGTAIAPENKQVMKKGWIFGIRNIIGTDYIIQVSKFTDGSTSAQTQNLKTYQGTNNENIYFKLTETEYLAFAEELQKRGRFVVGASTTIIKIRPGNGKDGDEAIFSEFGNDFNIGATAGWQLTDPKKETSIALVGGLAFSSIKVTPQTTRGFIDSESTQSAITFSLGAIVEIQKFQISAFGGIDTMSGEIGRNWIYGDRLWIGLGFGYEIFKPKGSDDN